MFFILLKNKMSIEDKLEKSGNGKKIGKIERTTRQVCLIAGIAIQLCAWYVGYYKAGEMLKQEKYKEAAKYHAIGYVPGYMANFLLASAGISYGKDLFRKIIRKRKKKK